MGDPLEGLTDIGTIRTGASLERVQPVFRRVIDAVVDAIDGRGDAVFAYGSVVTGQAVAPGSDVDVMAIGIEPSVAGEIGASLSATFAGVCRGVEIAVAQPSDITGDGDEAYENRVFLRHYCVVIDGSSELRPSRDFPGDRRAARGFNGDIARHAAQWRDDLRRGEPADAVATRMSRKSLLAVAGLVSVHDETWTTDRRIAAERWGEVAPEMRESLAQMVSWSARPTAVVPGDVQRVLDTAVDQIVGSFDDLIGLWGND